MSSELERKINVAPSQKIPEQKHSEKRSSQDSGCIKPSALTTSPSKSKTRLEAKNPKLSAYLEKNIADKEKENCRVTLGSKRLNEITSTSLDAQKKVREKSTSNIYTIIEKEEVIQRRFRTRGLGYQENSFQG